MDKKTHQTALQGGAHTKDTIACGAVIASILLTIACGAFVAQSQPESAGDASPTVEAANE